MKLLEVKNLSFEIGSNKILNIINFSLNENEILSIIGQSGSGKTMLSKLLMGMEFKNSKTDGEIKYLNENILSLDKDNLRKYRGEKIGYITQNPLAVFLPFQKIKETFLETYLSHNISKNEAIKIAKTSLKKVNLENTEEILGKYPFELSGGMLQRVMIAIVIGLNPKIIIADEPTSALDSYNRFELIKTFRDLNQMGITIILITHDYYLMKQISNKCLIFNMGELVEEFNPQTVDTNSLSEYGKELFKATEYTRKGEDL